jgi:hypothetical protein
MKPTTDVEMAHQRIADLLDQANLDRLARSRRRHSPRRPTPSGQGAA